MDKWPDKLGSHCMLYRPMQIPLISREVKERPQPGQPAGHT